LNKLKNDDNLCLQLVEAVHVDKLSIPAAAEKLGVARRSAYEFFGKEKKWMLTWWGEYENLTKDVNNPKVKILFFDIETSPILGNVWSLWQQNVGLNQIQQDWYVLSYAAKWQHKDEVIYEDKSKSWDSEDDSELLKGIWKLLDEADIVIGQNSKRFDEKKLNARFILNGMKPPSSYRSIDTLEIAKRHFGFTSNKLEYMSHKLCKKYKKLNHGKFAGFELWRQCLAGNPEAWAEMEDYNKHDVLALEELYEILRPWYKAHPNLNIYHNETNNYCTCGASDWEHSGYHYTNLSKFDRFQCKACGAEVRGRVNLLPANKRENLKSNII
jgi:uncharacterized protein YprB with RNaseH-like and TPR domain